MTSIEDVCIYLEQLAPLALAESWDNVGLLLGDSNASVQRIMTCLTVSQATVDEAVSQQCQFIVSHHPIPFRPVSRITTADPTGRLLWKLASAKIAVYSPHTAWDNATRGINQQLAEMIGLENIRPMKPATGRAELAGLGSGRTGELSCSHSAQSVLEIIQKNISSLQPSIIGQPGAIVKRIGIVCGSGASLLELAEASGCDCLVTGEATYHQCLDALHRGITVILLGHHGSERFAMDVMAEMLTSKFPNLNIWASRDEFDPTIGLSSP
jgi:dinuclear metal center YbgI/SA1388 family protein